MNTTTLTTSYEVNTPKGKLPVAKAYRSITTVADANLIQFLNEEEAAHYADKAVAAGKKFQAAAQVVALYLYGRQNEIDAAYAAGDITYAMWYGRTWRLRRALLKDSSLPKTYLDEKRSYSA